MRLPVWYVEIGDDGASYSDGTWSRTANRECRVLFGGYGDRSTVQRRTGDRIWRRWGFASTSVSSNLRTAVKILLSYACFTFISITERLGWLAPLAEIETVAGVSLRQPPDAPISAVPPLAPLPLDPTGQVHRPTEASIGNAHR